MEELIIYPQKGIDSFCQLFWDWLQLKRAEEGKSADAIARTENLVSASMLSRLKQHMTGKSRYSSFDIETFYKLDGLISTKFEVEGLPWKPRGDYYSASELLAIALRLDAVGYPMTDEDELYTGPNSEAVELLKKNIGSQPIQSFCTRTGISRHRLDALLHGETPTIDDIAWMSRAFPEGYKDLAQMYGVDLRAKAQQQEPQQHQSEPQYKEAIDMITAAMDGASVEDFPEIKNELYACLAGNRIHPTQISTIVGELGMELSAIYDLRVAYGYPGERDKTNRKQSKPKHKSNGAKV